MIKSILLCVLTVYQCAEKQAIDRQRHIDRSYDRIQKQRLRKIEDDFKQKIEKSKEDNIKAAERAEKKKVAEQAKANKTDRDDREIEVQSHEIDHENGAPVLTNEAYSLASWNNFINRWLMMEYLFDANQAHYIHARLNIKQDVLYAGIKKQVANTGSGTVLTPASYYAKLWFILAMYDGAAGKVRWGVRIFAVDIFIKGKGIFLTFKAGWLQPFVYFDLRKAFSTIVGYFGGSVPHLFTYQTMQGAFKDPGICLMIPLSLLLKGLTGWCIKISAVYDMQGPLFTKASWRRFSISITNSDRYEESFDNLYADSMYDSDRLRDAGRSAHGATSAVRGAASTGVMSWLYGLFSGGSGGSSAAPGPSASRTPGSMPPRR